MKVQINNIYYVETEVRELQSISPISFIPYNPYANCTVYFDNGDSINYRVNLLWDKDLSQLIDKIKSKVIENVGKINV